MAAIRLASEADAPASDPLPNGVTPAVAPTASAAWAYWLTAAETAPTSGRSRRSSSGQVVAEVAGRLGPILERFP